MRKVFKIARNDYNFEIRGFMVKGQESKKKINKEKVQEDDDNFYPVVEIDRSMAIEAGRRNTSIIIWYKRLIDATIVLTIASILFTMIAVIFAFSQPMPDLYGSALDGSLRRLDYVREKSDPRLQTMRSALLTESARQADLVKSDLNVKPSVEAIVSNNSLSKSTIIEKNENPATTVGTVGSHVTNAVDEKNSKIKP